MGPLRARHRADTVVQRVGVTLQAVSARGDGMLPRVVRQFIHVYGNGRAVANARRDQYRDRFVHERIDAVARRLDDPQRAQGGRGAA